MRVNNIIIILHIAIIVFLLQILHYYCIIIAGEEHHEYPLHVESFAMDWDKIGTADRSGSKVIIEFILHFYCIYIAFLLYLLHLNRNIAFIPDARMMPIYTTFSMMRA